MSRIIKKSSAGTMESSDMYVEISPADDIKIELDSVVSAQFGDEIRSLISEVRLWSACSRHPLSAGLYRTQSSDLRL